jgi:hypothetical protein
MFPSHTVFQASVDAVEAHLHFSERESEVLKLGVRLESPATETESAIRKLTLAAQRSNPKRFLHTWAVVEIYAAIEQLVEGLIRDYLLRLQRIVSRYDKLPSTIIAVHTRKSLELLQSAERLGLTVSEVDLVANLHGCNATPLSYTLNHEAFTLHGSNIRSEQVRLLFKEVGIDNAARRAYQSKAYTAFLDGLAGNGSHPLQRPNGKELVELDRLVDLRNEAAHGVPSNFLSADLLGEHVTFARAFGLALVEMLEESVLEAEVAHNGKPIGKLISVINANIVCVDLEHFTRIGDTLVAKTAKGRYKSSLIKRMQISNKDVLEADRGCQVGIEVDFSAKMNQEFYLLGVTEVAVPNRPDEPSEPLDDEPWRNHDDSEEQAQV